jgi:ketosteroid isomerase-like protein
MEPDNVELVRRLWEAFERGGIEAVLEIADEDVEWEPYGGGGAVYRGHEGLRAYMSARAENDEEIESRMYSAFSQGDAVVARGEVRIHGPHGIVTMQPGWLYEFKDGKLIRFRGFPTQEAAMRAAGLAPQEPRAIVRDLWAGFNGGGIDRMLEMVHEDAEWRPYRGAQEVYKGHDGIRRYYSEVAGTARDASATEYTIAEVGDTVVVSGSLQTVDDSGAIAQQQIHWVYWVRDGKVACAASFAHRGQAEQAARSGELPSAVRR